MSYQSWRVDFLNALAHYLDLTLTLIRVDGSLGLLANDRGGLLKQIPDAAWRHLVIKARASGSGTVHHLIPGVSVVCEPVHVGEVCWGFVGAGVVLSSPADLPAVEAVRVHLGWTETQAQRLLRRLPVMGRSQLEQLRPLCRMLAAAVGETLGETGALDPADAPRDPLRSARQLAGRLGALLTAAGPEDQARLAADQFMQIPGAQAAAVGLYHRDTGLLRLIAGAGSRLELPDYTSPDDLLFSAVWVQQAPMAIADVATDPRAAFLRQQGAPGGGCYVAPIAGPGGDFHGVGLLLTDHPGPVPAEATRTIDLLCRLLGLRREVQHLEARWQRTRGVLDTVWSAARLASSRLPPRAEQWDRPLAQVAALTDARWVALWTAEAKELALAGAWGDIPGDLSDDLQWAAETVLNGADNPGSTWLRWRYVPSDGAWHVGMGLAAPGGVKGALVLASRGWQPDGPVLVPALHIIGETLVHRLAMCRMAEAAARSSAGLEHVLLDVMGVAAGDRTSIMRERRRLAAEFARYLELGSDLTRTVDLVALLWDAHLLWLSRGGRDDGAGTRLARALEQAADMARRAGLDEVARSLQHRAQETGGDGVAGQDLATRLVAVVDHFLERTEQGLTEPEAFRALADQAGKSLDPDLVSAFRTGYGRMSPPADADEEAEGPLSLLTPRELDVLKLISEGMDNEEIARALWISVKTVKVHVSSVLAKLKVRDRTQAAICYLRLTEEDHAERAQDGG